jgi:hypothetical protein
VTRQRLGHRDDQGFAGLLRGQPEPLSGQIEVDPGEPGDVAQALTGVEPKQDHRNPLRVSDLQHRPQLVELERAPDDLRDIDSAVSRITVQGARYPEQLQQQVGRGRAIEILVGADDFTGELAERYGYVNRAVPDAELDTFIDCFARRVAGFEKEAIVGTKAFVN